MNGRHVVTGVAGFIGSTTAETLLERGEFVVGVDSINHHYDPSIKDSNLAQLARYPNFEFVKVDLCEVDYSTLLERGDTVYHLAALAGVRDSWATNFSAYVHSNVQATQRLLEAATVAGVERVVYASSSSVYGNAAVYPVTETTLTKPHSPYGVTKLAAEHLCSLYAANRGLSVVSLRYFTVYGPRQRPDMAIHRIVKAGLEGTSFEVYGDGSQRRDFTFVSDVVHANLLAGSVDVAPGTVVNIAGGTDISLNDLIAEIGEAIGRPVEVSYKDWAAGDVRRTGGEIDLATAQLGWIPDVAIDEGVRAQVAWHRSLIEAESRSLSASSAAS